jgi:hypothetical protein
MAPSRLCIQKAVNMILLFSAIPASTLFQNRRFMVPLIVKTADALTEAALSFV